MQFTENNKKDVARLDDQMLYPIDKDRTSNNLDRNPKWYQNEEPGAILPRT